MRNRINILKWICDNVIVFVRKYGNPEISVNLEGTILALIGLDEGITVGGIGCKWEEWELGVGILTGEDIVEFGD